MGKGGEKVAEKDTTKSLTKWALSKKAKIQKLSDEELRKWAKAYGVKDIKDEREELLTALVSLFPIFSLCS